MVDRVGEIAVLDGRIGEVEVLGVMFGEAFDRKIGTEVGELPG